MILYYYIQWIRDERHSLEVDRFPVIYSLSIQFIISISVKLIDIEGISSDNDLISKIAGDVLAWKRKISYWLHVLHHKLLIAGGWPIYWFVVRYKVIELDMFHELFNRLCEEILHLPSTFHQNITHSLSLFFISKRHNLKKRDLFAFS